ncbi:MAG: nucleotidyltransferase domain-containing protein [Phycisphaerae bacterium]
MAAASGDGIANRRVSGESMGIDEQTVREIVRRILSVTRPDKIILFGSAATGEMTADSDVDLLIVEPDIPDRRAEYVRVRRALGGLKYPFDILFISTDRFERSKDVIGGLAYPADKYGRVIYEAA